MKKSFLLLLTFFLVNTLFAQDIRIEKPILSGLSTLQSPLWGDDVIVSNFEPIGPITSVRANTGTIYVAINDTLATSNLGIIIMQSTNLGVSWSLFGTGINTRAKFAKLKFVSTGTAGDSLYLFMQYGSNVYCWNFRNASFKPVGYGGILSTFDVVGASSGALYYFYDTLPTAVKRYSSINGGASWINRGNITSSGVKPKICISAGDSLILNYYGPVLADTATSVIRAARYMQSSPGTLTSSGFQDVATENVAKTEFMSVIYNGNVWFVYTTGTTGGINIKGRKSIDAGTTYGTAIDIAANPNVDEYWFDIKYYSGGFDLSYYSDSLQTGPPTNNTDKIMYSYSILSGSTFGTATQVSENPPSWSANNYIPTLCEIPPSDAGIAWIGNTGTGKKVFWDRFSAVSNIGNQNEIVNSYSLSQNYPNPFNPITKIDFAVSKSGFVSLKVYDLLGKEVATVLSRNLNAGKYSVDFNASKLSSGIYFYSLESNGFKDVKKMMLIK